ncbi:MULTISPECIES: FAD-dependent oxidoreductase [unclassified Streptomyces]|uniref:FAD-dependent monooxygenase n=1 Tax=Streptomyces sp. NBC_00119 TaxID=2975659 RepID=A0AAU1TYZ9_9ACTN|nr:MULTISPECIES: NAD(P)/FAD-dependent oxidoreductase [unclassified Streptomyces]MCX5322687.1 FAD-dependent monooxygenase [Streptomyces sp. NBC_00120]WSE02998.1 FAD-dependent monooxygenase [Streptomyces sp. NBC_01445]
MSVPATKRGRVAVIGAGPAGMATALSVHQAGHDVVLLERYPQARPAGNILNLWPPPIKALGLLGVDIADLGAPCYSEFRSAKGRTRVRVNLPEHTVADYGGGFIGLLRPELYQRLLAAMPPGVLQLNRTVESFDQDQTGVRLKMADGKTIEVDVLVGADGIDSLVRRTLWGDSPKREHNLHIFGGFTFDEDVVADRGLCIVSHSRTVQGSWTSIRHKGRHGFQWWVLGAHDAATTFDGDLHATATAMGAEFAAPLPQLIAATEPGNVQRWVLRDRKPLKQWSKGRATLVGDAAHPTSPYAAYGAGMATEDGYYLGRRLAGLDLSDHTAVRAALDAFEAPRKPHTARQVQQAYILGKVFHHTPGPLQRVRDTVLDRTPFLQKVAGESSPGEILAQIAAIDEAEKRFVAVRAGA